LNTEPTFQQLKIPLFTSNSEEKKFVVTDNKIYVIVMGIIQCEQAFNGIFTFSGFFETK